jgi:hypothetical protein
MPILDVCKVLIGGLQGDGGFFRYPLWSTGPFYDRCCSLQSGKTNSMDSADIFHIEHILIGGERKRWNTRQLR